MTKYSIIVPIYNVEDYLKECIESILNQTYKNFELILVDDGSPDNCPKLCDEWVKKDKRIKVIHKKNGGLVSARKAGVKVATGEYILCVDGDDYISIDLLNKVSNVIAKFNCDIVCFGYYTGKDFKKVCPNTFRHMFYDKNEIINKIYPNLIESKNGDIFPNNIWSKVIKREIYLKYQLKVDNNIKIGEDLVCTKPIIANCNSLYILPDCLYFYRSNELSMTKIKKPFDLNCPILIYNHLIDSLKNCEYNFMDQIFRNSSHNIFNVVITQFYNKNKSKKEIKSIIKNYLDMDICKKIINESKFHSLSRKLMLFSLKHRCYFLFDLYSKLHNF